MNRRRNSSRREGEENLNEAVPPQTHRNPQLPIEQGVMSNVEIRSSYHSLIQLLSTKVFRDAKVQVNPNANNTLQGLEISQG